MADFLDRLLDRAGGSAHDSARPQRAVTDARFVTEAGRVESPEVSEQTSEQTREPSTLPTREQKIIRVRSGPLSQSRRDRMEPPPPAPGARSTHPSATPEVVLPGRASDTRSTSSTANPARPSPSSAPVMTTATPSGARDGAQLDHASAPSADTSAPRRGESAPPQRAATPSTVDAATTSRPAARPPVSADRGSAAETEAAGPIIRISIGRIDVRAPQRVPASTPPVPTTPRVTLDGVLTRSRDGERR